MLHSRCNSNKIKHLHERCLRLTYCDKTSSYEEVLEKVRSVSIHHRNIQSLAIEMDKVKNEPAPTITANIFGAMPENHYNLRNYNDFRIPFARIVYHGTDSISYQVTKIWDIVPIELRCFKSVLKNLLENGHQATVLAGFVNGIWMEASCGF